MSHFLNLKSVAYKIVRRSADASLCVILMIGLMVPMTPAAFAGQGAGQEAKIAAQAIQQEKPSGQSTDQKKPSDPVPNPTSNGATTGITQRSQVSSIPDYPELVRIGVDTAKQFPLSMRDAIRMALSDNNDIEIARQNVRIQEFVLKGTYGAYDPLATGESLYQRTINPIASFIGGGPNGTQTDKNFNNSATISGLSPFFGGSYQLDFVSNRAVTNNLFTTLSPQYPTSLTLTYTQPLLRGLLIDDPRRQIEIAKKNLALSDAQFRQRAIEVIANVQQAYWDLVFALKNVQVQRDSLREAQAQLEHIRRMVAEGLSAPIDIVETETQVANFQESLYTAINSVTSAENNLKNMTLRNQFSPLWNQAIQPTDSVDLKAPAVTLDNAVAAAYSNRPEIKQSDANIEVNEINRRYFRDQTRPQINLTGTYGLIGLSGVVAQTANPLTGSQTELTDRVNLLSALNGLPPLPADTSGAVPDILIGGVGQSYSNLFSNSFNTYSVGITFSLPIRNRTAKAQLGQTLVEGEQIRTQRQQLEEQIQVDVRNALQSARTAEAVLHAATIERDRAEQQYTSEQRKLNAGQSTLFLLFQRQTAVATARGEELRAQTDLNKAIAVLQRVTGSTLEANSIVISAH